MKKTGSVNIEKFEGLNGRSIFSNDDITSEQISMFDGRDMALFASGMYTWKADMTDRTISRTNLSGGPGDTWTFSRFLKIIHEKDRAAISALLAFEKNAQTSIDVDVRIHHNNDYRWFKIKGAIYVASADGKAYALGVAYDISKLKQRTQRLEFLEKHDYLTGLINMDAFDESFDQISKFNMYPQALVLANIDHLKQINDTLGYRAGNTLIKSVAHVIEECFLDADVVARIGGGEYCAVFSGIDEAEIRLNIKEAGMMLHKMYLNLIKTEVTFGYAICNAQQEFSILYRHAMDNMQKKKAMKRLLSDGSVVDALNRVIRKKAGWGKRVTRLQSLSVQIAQRMALDERRHDEIKVLAKIADIGLIGIDDRLVRDRKKLGGKDRLRYLQHIEYGRSMICSIDSLSEMEGLYLDIYKRYDEWKDGIAMSSRIIACAAAFDDITYGVDDVSSEKLYAALNRRKGVSLCPDIVDTLLSVVSKHYAQRSEEEHDEA